MISQTAFSFAADDVPADTITAHGETLYVSEWAKRLGIAEDTLRKRLSAGWDHVEAVTAPKQVTNRPRALRTQVPDGTPGSRTWYDLPYERDRWAQEFVEAHPDGASMDEVGAAMGVEVSWICEIEQGAFKKLKKLLARVGSGQLESLNGQLALLGGRKNTASIDLGAFTLLQLLVERLGLDFGDDDANEDEADEWEGEVVEEDVGRERVSSGHEPEELEEEDEDEEHEEDLNDIAARWLRDNDRALP